MIRTIILTLVAVAAFGQTTATTITDTIRIPVTNALFSGTVRFTPSHGMTCGTNSYVPQPVTVSVTNGALSVALVPNASCLPVDGSGNPASYYTAVWSGRNFSVTESIVVPVSATPVTFSAVRASTPTSATAVISPSQIAAAGATTGQGLVFNGSNWVASTFTATAAAHASSHAAAGSDAVTIAQSQVTNLATTLSGKVDTGDSRLTDARTPTTHATSHKNGGTDEIATATAAANAIPKAGAGGTLDAGWIPTLNQNTSGNAATATALANARTIYGTSFDGTGNIGSRSGNTTEMATVSGTKTTGKQLQFDASGNVAASSTDIGGGGSMTYPGAGVANSTGSAWGASYSVGTSANNLVQLTSGAALPAVSAANLTSFPTLNQNTTGTAAVATHNYSVR